MKHTPGPWKVHPKQVDYLEIDSLTWEVSDDGKKWIAHTLIEANAHLIAAAPEMYEALKERAAAISINCTCDHCSKIRAAIAKAEGRV